MATRRIVQAFPDARIVIVAQDDDIRLRNAAPNAGACGYALKDNLMVYAETLLTAILADRDAGDQWSRSVLVGTGCIGTNFQTLNDLGSLPGTVFQGVPSANDGLFSMTITVTAGSTTLVDPAARGFDAEGTNALPVFGVEVQQVPEPTTMVLLLLGPRCRARSLCAGDAQLRVAVRTCRAAPRTSRMMPRSTRRAGCLLPSAFVDPQETE